MFYKLFSMFNDLLCKVFAGREVEIAKLITAICFVFPGVFLLDRALYAITFSVLDIGVTYLWPWV